MPTWSTRQACVRQRLHTDLDVRPSCSPQHVTTIHTLHPRQPIDRSEHVRILAVTDMWTTRRIDARHVLTVSHGARTVQHMNQATTKTAMSEQKARRIVVTATVLNVLILAWDLVDRFVK